MNLTFVSSPDHDTLGAACANNTDDRTRGRQARSLLVAVDIGIRAIIDHILIGFQYDLGHHLLHYYGNVDVKWLLDRSQFLHDHRYLDCFGDFDTYRLKNFDLVCTLLNSWNRLALFHFFFSEFVCRANGNFLFYRLAFANSLDISLIPDFTDLLSPHLCPDDRFSDRCFNIENFSDWSYFYAFLQDCVFDWLHHSPLVLEEASLL